MAGNNDQAREDVPVYLFTGFLDAGKTKFIQETLEDRRFDTGERTLLLVCEEGEEEYDLNRLKRGKNTTTLHLAEDEADLTPFLLNRLQDEIKPQRVVVEYNGMWMLDSLYRAMPQGWVVYQEFCFADARTFLNYNSMYTHTFCCSYNCSKIMWIFNFIKNNNEWFFIFRSCIL